MSESTVELQPGDGRVGIAGLLPQAILAFDEPPDTPLQTMLETIDAGPSHVCVRAVVTNPSAASVRIRGIRWTYPLQWGKPKGLRFPVLPTPRVYCTEALRGDAIEVGTTQGSDYWVPLGNVPIVLGESEDAVFPGFFVASPAEPIGLFVAQASQRRFRGVFHLRGRVMDCDRWALTIDELGGNGVAVTVPPGENLPGDALWFEVCDSADPQHCTTLYRQFLQRDGAYQRRALNPLPRQRIYCSWNYDFAEDIDEAKMLAQIPLLKEHFPSVKFLQLDDGYQVYRRPKQRAMIDFLWGDLEHPFDPARFPDGPQRYCQKVRDAGMRPAIWLGLWAAIDCPMLREHPEWILRDDLGRAIEFADAYGGVAILDVSLPDVQSYLDRVARTVFGEWGFEGVKLDFYSFAFRMRAARFRDRSQTQAQLHRTVPQIFRRHLPQDGFLGACVACGTGHPFFYDFDYYRNAVDIGTGSWKEARRIALWTANTNLLLSPGPAIPNMDSVGFSRHIGDPGWQTWLNLLAVSGGAVEVSGDLRSLSPERLRRCARVIELSDPDRLVQCPDLTTVAPGEPPSLWLATGRGDLLLGVFNFRDVPATIDLAPARTRIEPVFRRDPRDAWTGAAAPLPDTLSLAPRESRLYLLDR